MDGLKECRVQPSVELRPWVSEFHLGWTTPGQVYDLVHLPDGEAGLLFRMTGEGTGDLSTSGPWKRARYKKVPAARFYIRACLHAGRARRILGVPLYELADRIVPLDALWNSLGRTLCAQLIENGPDRAVPLFEQAISEFMRHQVAEPAPVVSRILRAIDDSPCTRIEECARSTGLSTRQLRHLFRVELGMGPKHYARIARLRHLLATEDSNLAWADRAVGAGFYDQAHMIADFRDLLDLTPNAFLIGRMRGE
jgi:AraC-like DNA-binding protein